MTILAYEIQARTKLNMLAVASENDFRLAPSVDGMDFDVLFSRPSVSLYCIDPTSGDLLLTETPEGIDIGAAAFVYEAQYRHAVKVYTVPLDELLEATGKLLLPADILFVHSTGRCGSTLLAKALAASGVTTFSEPDIFTQVALLGRPNQTDQVDAIQTLYGGFARFFTRGRSGPFVFKLRGASSHHADYIAAALPSTKSVFLYRNAVSVARSYARLTGRNLESWRLNAEERKAWSVLVPILRYLSDPVSGYDLMAALWAGPVVHYLNSHDRGFWLGAIDYTDLIANPNGLLTWLLNALRADENINGRRNFQIHSQAGSHLDPQQGLLAPDLEQEIISPLFTERLTKSLQRIDPMLSPHMALPGSKGSAISASEYLLRG